MQEELYLRGKTPTYKVGDQSNNFSQWGSNPLLREMMHTRAERKMLPFRQPARGAVARFASPELSAGHFRICMLYLLG